MRPCATGVLASAISRDRPPWRRNPLFLGVGKRSHRSSAWEQIAFLFIGREGAFSIAARFLQRGTGEYASGTRRSATTRVGESIVKPRSSTHPTATARTQQRRDDHDLHPRTQQRRPWRAKSPGPIDTPGRSAYLGQDRLTDAGRPILGTPGQKFSPGVVDNQRFDALLYPQFKFGYADRKGRSA